MTRAAGAPGTAGVGFRLADVTDPRFTAEQLETVAAFEGSVTPPEVREEAALRDQVIEAMRATRECRAGMAFGVPEDARDHFLSAMAVAAVSAYRAAQDGGAEAAVRRVEALCWQMDAWREGDAFAETPADVTQMWSASIRAALAPQAGDGAR